MHNQLDSVGCQFHPNAKTNDKLVARHGSRQLNHAGLVVLQTSRHTFQDLMKRQGDDYKESMKISRPTNRTMTVAVMMRVACGSRTDDPFKLLLLLEFLV